MSEGALITIYWRDIPAQVTARAGRRKSAVQLDDRFQVAIDRAAAVAGLTTTNDYLEEWRRETEPCDGDLDAVVQAAADELEAAFDQTRLAALIRSGGIDTTKEHA